VVSSISRILENPVYVGVIHYNKRDASGKKAKHNPEEEHIFAADAAPAAIDSATYQKVQDQLEKVRSLPTKARTRHLNLFAGLLRCDHCGGSLYLGTTRKKTKNGTKVHKYYKCRTSDREGRSRCPGMSIREEELMEVVIGHLKELSLDDDALQTMEAELSKKTSGNLQNLEEELQRLHQRDRGYQDKKDRLFVHPLHRRDHLPGRLR
jgi:hypothetical protein